MECLKMIKVRHGEYTHTVPCGKCPFCLTNKRSQWMFRIHFEMKNQQHPGWFITLTYEEKYVKRAADGRLSLRFKDVQKFLKKLRKAKYYAKYVCVGEYGGKTKRPHYHMLLWSDCPPEKLQTFWTTKRGSQLGNLHIGRITMQSAMYTLKYIINPKQKAEHGIEKTRAQFSQGLGLSYLSTAVYYYHTLDYDNPKFTSRIDGRQVALPRYYRNKIFTKHQTGREGSRVKWQAIRERRKEMRKLIKLGIKDVNAYMNNLRVDQAKRIMKSTKFNQTL